MGFFSKKKKKDNEKQYVPHVHYPDEWPSDMKIEPGVTPTVVICEPGANRYRIIATEYWSQRMIGELATTSPRVHVMREDDKVIEATFPGEWFKIESPQMAELRNKKK